MTAKLIFSDIDGTLINQDLKVTPKTRDAIRKQIMKGNIFVPVSARMPKAIMTAAGQITKVCPLVAYNGALVLDETGRPIVSKFMEAKVAVKICKYVEQKQNGCAWNVYSGYHWYRSQPKSPLVQREEDIVKVASTPASLTALQKLKGVHKVLIMGRPANLDQLQEQLEPQFPDLYIVKSAANLLEIMKKGVSKSSGVRALAQAFNVKLTACYAFGDNYNDEDMLKAVGHPYLMGNGPADLKKRVKNVTLDNNHDGIAAVLNNL